MSLKKDPRPSLSNKVTDNEFMTEALALAKLSYTLGEVPVGAVVVVDNRVVGRGYNRREHMGSMLEHAELMALDEASKRLGRWRLFDASVYVTLEPCIMCSGALLHARIKSLFFGTADPKFGAIKSLFNLANDPRLNHRFSYEEGLLGLESAELLQRFFKELRLKRRSNPPLLSKGAGSLN